MNQLFQSWKDSLMLLSPSQGKIFGLVVLKMVKDTTKVMVTYFWWLVLLLAIGPFIGFQQDSSYYVILKVIFIMALFFSVRPSIDRKNNVYFIRCFVQQGWRAIPLLLFFLMPGRRFVRRVHSGSFSYVPLLYLGPIFFNSSEPYAWILYSTADLMGIISFSAFCFLFLFDSRGLSGIIKSFLNAMKMMIYNLPFCLLCGFALYAIADRFALSAQAIHAIERLSGISYFPVLYVISLPLSLFVLIISVSFWTAFYVKRVHDQYNLYDGLKEVV